MACVCALGEGRGEVTGRNDLGVLGSCQALFADFFPKISVPLVVFTPLCSLGTHVFTK